VLCAVAEFLVTFGGSYVCASFGENRSRNATVRVRTDGHTPKFKDESNTLCDVQHMNKMI